jgi:hypothetical protein
VHNPLLTVQVVHSLDQLLEVVSRERFWEPTRFVFDLYKWKQVALLNQLQNNKVNMNQLLRTFNDQLSFVCIVLNQFDDVRMV